MTHYMQSTGYTACGTRYTPSIDTTDDQFYVTCTNCVARMAHG